MELENKLTCVSYSLSLLAFHAEPHIFEQQRNLDFVFHLIFELFFFCLLASASSSSPVIFQKSIKGVFYDEEEEGRIETHMSRG